MLSCPSSGGLVSSKQGFGKQIRVQTAGGVDDGEVQPLQANSSVGIQPERHVVELAAVVRQVGAGQENTSGVSDARESLCGGFPVLRAQAADVEREHPGSGATLCRSGI